MHLNHVNLCSSDPAALAETLATHFGYRVVDVGEVPNGGRFALVVGEDGSELVVTEIPPTPDGGSAYPLGFHFGLIQDSREAVLAKQEQLRAAGLAPSELHDGFEAWGATWTAFFCPLGDGLEVEINFRTPSAVLD